MIVDCHIHIQLGPEKVVEVDRAKDVLRSARRAGIDRIGLLGNLFRYGIRPNEEQLRKINDSTIEVVRRYPDFFGLCYINPALSAKAATREIERCVRKGLRGVKLEVDVNSRKRRLDPIMEKAAEFDIPVLHHSWYKSSGKKSYESDPTDIADLAARHPRTQIIMAHLNGVGMRGVLDIKDFENVSIDTSGAQPFAGMIEYAVEMLGADRVLFGSDVCCRDFACQLGKVLDAGISSRDRRKILGGNACRLFKLNGSSGNARAKVAKSDLSGLIDVNTSLGSWPFQRFSINSPASLAKHLADRGVTSAWVCALESVLHPDPDVCDAPLERRLRKYATLHFVKTINPTLPGWRERLEKWASERDVRAIKLYPNYHRYELCSPEVLALAECAGKLGLPVLIQMRLEDERGQSPLMPVPGVEVGPVVDLASRFQKVTFVALSAYIQEATKLAAASPNLLVDTSFVERGDAIETLLASVPADRVLFGSRAPFLSVRANVMKLACARIPGAARRKIANGNVKRL